MIVPTEVTTEGAVEAYINAINQGYDAITMEPWSYDPFKPVVDMAKEAGIPIVNVHVPYDDAEDMLAMVVIDNPAYGKSAVELINSEKGGKANILIMMTRADVMNQVVIRDTMIDECAIVSPDLKVVATEFTEADAVIAAEKLEGAFLAYPEIDVVVFLESGGVVVAATVAKEMGILDDIMIIGVDDPPDLIESIRAGEVWGSLCQNFWKQGYESVRIIADYYLGNPTPTYVDAGVFLITQDNVDTYGDESAWAPVTLKGMDWAPELLK